MRESFLVGWSDELLSTPAGQKAMAEHVHTRYDECLTSIVPWTAHHLDLRGKEVLEIGCGTGSSTAAFARICARVDGYDIDARGVEGARHRMEILRLPNVGVHLHAPQDVLPEVRRRHAAGIDVVLYYAVLEHQTFEERIESIRTCWDLLRPGGLFVVTDTPNRLTYCDFHTSFLPFYHVLPHEVATAYAKFSPRADFAADIHAALKKSDAIAQEQLIRWGRGVSYHDFELAIGDTRPLVVGDGFDPEILPIKPVIIEERILYTYWLERQVPAPVGFCRASLDLVLRKPGPGPRRDLSARELTGVIRPMTP